MKSQLVGLSLWSWLVLIGTMLPALSAAGDDQTMLASRQIGRGMNLANALDAPEEGAWGVTLEESYFSEIARAGFNSVVIPVRWSAHAGKTAPYRLDPVFLNRVDWAVEQGLKHHLAVVLRTHQYEGFAAHPEQELPRYYAIWDQLAAHFRRLPATCMFEISNEPGYTFEAPRWNAVTAEVLKIIRRSNPDRSVIACPIFGDGVGMLSSLELPSGDRNVLVRLYYFAPTEFTMQGASWIAGAGQWLGIKWMGTKEEQQAIAADFDRVEQWGRAHGRTLYLGEFGVLNTADPDSRARWTRCVAAEAKKHGISWAYWEFCSVFGAYDSGKREWNKRLLDALMSGD
jgi:endoglucanase